MRDNFTKPLDAKGKENWEKIFGKKPRQNGVSILVAAEPGEKRKDTDHARQMHNAHKKRKLDRDEQKFVVPYDNPETKSQETIFFKKSDSPSEKRQKIADGFTRAGHPVNPSDVQLIND